MKYTVISTNRFEKSVKKCVKRGLDVNELKCVIDLLARTGALPLKYRPHKLVGKYEGLWECHIAPDWLVMWEQNDTSLTLLLLDTGTHSDLF